MKKILFLLTFLLPFFAQSQKHYIIPDIGAPGMAIYVEMIAPHDQKGYFGNDGLYLPGVDTEVTVNITKNAQFVTFGPLVVSWEGRMISTHIFVDKLANPTIIFPTVAFQVEFNIAGSAVPTSRAFTFNLVRPQSLGINGDISGINETVLGQGNLGVRSYRGAMIVDSLSLKANTTYTISTNDPDGNITNGNQGFLPAIILSKGPIKGNNSTISVSALNKNAGPGGGGGGGSFLDIIAGSGGSDGGSGFTSGGKGGTNTYGNSKGNYKNFGQGTAANGNSINGIESFDPTPIGGWEASYGGTGHPFGTNGTQSLSGSSANAKGGFGGGSGWNNNSRGGAGGYATTGGGDNVTGGTTGGQAHGNTMIVPLAGGSGGSGGNPEAQFPVLIVSSGEGGGGAGGVNIFGESVSDMKVNSNGFDGTGGGRNSDGGPGSGGSAIVMSKVGMTDVELSVQGGSRSGRNGGAGRVRLDGFGSSTDPTILPSSAAAYRGVSTDTSNYIKPRHNLFGTKAPSKELLVYMKSITGDWQLDRTITAASNNWITTFNFDPTHEDKYYVVVIQKETKVVSDFTYVPDYVLSQAATNVFLFDDPIINCPKDTSFDVINCANVIYEDSIQIQSVGGDFLHLNVQNLWTFNNKGFEVLNVGEYDVSPQSPDSLFYIKFRYTKQSGQTGTVTDTLTLVHNSPSQVACKIAVSINLQDPKVTFLDATSSKTIDTLFLGEICVGDLATGSFNLRNESEFDLTNLRFDIEANGTNDATDFMASPNTITSIGKSQSTKVDINFNDLDNNTFMNGVSVTLYVYSEQCADPIDSLVLSVKVLTSELALSVANNTLDFGNVQVGNTKDMVVTLKNTGDKPARITTPPAVNSPFISVSSSVPLPFTLNPAKFDASAKIDFTYRFTPSIEGNFLDTTLFTSEANVSANSCDAEIELFLKASAKVGEVSYKDTLDFGILYECQTDSADAFIKNESTDIIKLNGATTLITGLNANFFRIDAKPNTISVGGQNNFLIAYIPPTIPTYAGLKIAQLEFELDPSSGKKEIIFIKAEVDSFMVDYSPGKPFDMGFIPLNFNSAPKVLTLNNSGKLPRTVTGFKQPANTKITITHPLGFPVEIPAGGSANFDVDITLLTADEGIYSEKDTAIFAECDNVLEVDIVAVGVIGKLEIVTDLNLPPELPCFDITKTVKFRNIGTAELSLDSAIVFENGVEIYRILNVPHTMPLPNIDFDPEIKIAKSGLTIGSIYKATLIAYVSENGITTPISKEITIEIKSGLVLTPNPLDFGNVILNSPSSQSVTISLDPSVPRTSTEDLIINIDRLNLAPAYTEYQFISPNKFTLNLANPSQVVNITFTPTVSQNYDATLDLQVSVPLCDYEVPLELRGAVGAGDTLLVYVKDFLEVEPNQNNFRIPIYGKLMSQDKTTSSTKQIEISKLDINFNKTVYFPMTLSNGTYVSRTTDAELSKISIKMDTPVTMTTEEEIILTEMIGTTMLGNKKDNLIQVSSSLTLADETGIAEKQVHGGLFNLTICEEGGERLLEHTDGFNYTFFNTLNGIEIQANLVEPGYHKVSLVNSTGQTQLEKEISRFKDDNNQYIINFDSSDLSSGVYYIVFETPARFKTQKIIIIR